MSFKDIDIHVFTISQTNLNIALHENFGEKRKKLKSTVQRC